MKRFSTARPRGLPRDTAAPLVGSPPRAMVLKKPGGAGPPGYACLTFKINWGA
jgi:hypothetical protein